MTFLLLSLLMVSKYWPPQLGLEQSERKHASVIWRLFLTFRHMYAHPHLNLSSIPNFHPFFTLQLFLYPCHHIFPGFLPLCHLLCGLQAMWVVLYWRLCLLFCSVMCRNSYSCSTGTRAVRLWRSFPALVEHETKHLPLQRSILISQNL